MKHQLRHFHLATTVQRKLQKKKFEGRDYLVLPVVALMEGVVWPVNAPTPEFVPAATLALAPASWNGRPVMMNHPEDDGGRLSANEPDILERQGWGIIFNTQYKDKKLEMEAWLDIEKAKDVDGAEEILERVDDGDMVEVSVGAWIVLDESEGVFDGQEYEGIWTEMIPDHLATLEEGDIGACSNEMGCGLPRAATVHLATRRGFVALSAKERTPMAKPTLAAALQTAKAKWTADHPRLTLAESDVNLRTRIDSALSEIESNYLGIEAVDPDEGTVTYAMLNPEDYSFEYARRGYKAKADGTVTLGADAEKVLKLVDFQTAAQREKRAACKCGTHPPQPAAQPKELVSMDKKDRVIALIASKRTSFTSEDQAYLESLSDQRLTALEDEATRPGADSAGDKQKDRPGAGTGTGTSSTGTPGKSGGVGNTGETDDQRRQREDRERGGERERQTASATGSVEEKPKPQTVDEYLAEAPDGVKEVLQEGMRAAQAKRNVVVKALKDSGRFDYTDVEIAKMSIADLERMAKLAGVSLTPAAPVDFSGQGLPRAAAGNPEDNRVPSPPNLKERLAAASKAS